MPHSKCYAKISSESDGRWDVVTSANLSMAAWEHNTKKKLRTCSEVMNFEAQVAFFSKVMVIGFNSIIAVTFIVIRSKVLNILISISISSFRLKRVLSKSTVWLRLINYKYKSALLHGCDKPPGTDRAVVGL